MSPRAESTVAASLIASAVICIELRARTYKPKMRCGGACGDRAALDVPISFRENNYGRHSRNVIDNDLIHTIIILCTYAAAAKTISNRLLAEDVAADLGKRLRCAHATHRRGKGHWLYPCDERKNNPNAHILRVNYSRLLYACIYSI